MSTRLICHRMKPGYFMLSIQIQHWQSPIVRSGITPQVRMLQQGGLLRCGYGFSLKKHKFMMWYKTQMIGGASAYCNRFYGAYNVMLNRNTVLNDAVRQ